MEYEDNYSEWLWRILVVTDESERAEEYANSIVSLLDKLKDPPDIESHSIYGEKPTEKCRKALFILDESKRDAKENQAVSKWLRALVIDPKKSEKYMVLLLDDKHENEGFMKPMEVLAESQVMYVKDGVDIYSWWSRLIRFLCKTRNWDNSAYILLHAGFGHDINDGKRMAEHIEKLEEQKKTIEIMLGQFGPRNLHKAQWHGGFVSNRPVSATDVELARLGTVNTKSNPKFRAVPNGDTSEPWPPQLNSETLGASMQTEEKCRINSFIANYISEEPLKPSWTDQKTFASVVPIFIIMKPDITVAEKCCLTDYAREFPKTHFLCIGEEPPSDYIKLVSGNVYGTKDLMNFIFHLLRELKLISSIKSKTRDSCVCAVQ